MPKQQGNNTGNSTAEKKKVNNVDYMMFQFLTPLEPFPATG